MKSIALNSIYLFALLLLSPWILLRSWRTGRYRQGLRQKLWGVRRSDLSFETNRPVVWLHGVSVGEVQLLFPLIEALQNAEPSCQFLLSTTTETGMELARKRLGSDRCFYFPLDFSWAVRRAIAVLNPQVIITGELELWPNLIDAAQLARVPMVVVNGRLSVASHRGYCRFSYLTRNMFQKLSAVAAQSEADAERFVDCGCSKSIIKLCGNVKFDNVQVDREHPRVRQLRELVGLRDESVLVAGSTQSPEELVTFAAFSKLRQKSANLKLIVVPRHPDRFEEVAKSLLAELQTDQRLLLRSELKGELNEKPDWDVLLVDSIGELRWWWGLADIALVGGSFGKRGGQNMLEPAAYGANVAFGPNTSNFRDIVRLLLAENAAIQLEDLDQILPWLESQIAEPQAGERRGRLAQRLVLQQQGATECVVETILPFLQREAGVEGLPNEAQNSRSNSRLPAA